MRCLPLDSKIVIYPNKTKRWFNSKNEQHSFNDQPTVVRLYRSRYWYKNNKLHRIRNKPAVIFSDGRQEYHLNGEQYFPEEN